MGVAITASPIIVHVTTGGEQGPPGPAGGTITRTTAQILSGHRLVTTDLVGELIYADSDIAAHALRPVWVTTGAWSAGVVATVVAAGVVEESSWAWLPGLPLFVGVNGALTQTAPAATYTRRVGEALTATEISFNVQQPIVT